MSYKQFTDKVSAYEFYRRLKLNPVGFSVHKPVQFGEIWQVSYRQWSLD